MSEGKARKRGLWTALALGALVLVGGLAFALLRGGGDTREPQEQQLRTAYEAHLLPMKALLDENKALAAEIRETYVEGTEGIQEAYYAKVRKDGEAPHRPMKAMVDRLAANNQRILDHLEAYREPATDRFEEQALLFEGHAFGYNERWRQMPAAALKGADPPYAQPSFPDDFPAAVDAEIETVKRKLGA